MKHLNYTETRKRQLSFFLLCAVVSVGILFGAVYGSGHSAESPLVHQYFSPAHCGGTVYEVFRNTLISLSLFVGTAFLLGVSAFGQPLGIIMLIYRGFGIGAAAVSEYVTKGMHAMPSVILLILPECTAVTIISVLAVRELMRSANSLFLYVTADVSHSERTFKLYCLKFAVLIIISVIISVFSTVMNYIFSGLR
ncbi:MAG: stage II sporulation protein M [Ruminococcus sp.]|nr:stage II sporulation protein M [Ruminococcus sp.]